MRKLRVERRTWQGKGGGPGQIFDRVAFRGLESQSRAQEKQLQRQERVAWMQEIFRRMEVSAATGRSRKKHLPGGLMLIPCEEGAECAPTSLAKHSLH